jgi:type I restriction enzyme S subunit
MNIPALRFPEFKEDRENVYKKHSFNDIFLFSTGKNIKQNEASPEFETPCVRYGELYHMYNEVITEVINRTNFDKSELTFSEGNEILLPSAGEDPLDIGSASALTVKNVAIGRTINILKPAKENVYSQIYVAYYINNKLRKQISTLAKGVSISNVYNSDLKTLEIILPTLPEQKRIATFLTEVDTKLTQLKQKKTLLEQYKKGVMQKIFTQELRFKDDDGNDFADWEKKKLGEIGETYNGLSGKTKENFGTGKPYIQYKQIFDDSKIDISRFEFVELQENENQNRVNFGDVFFTVSSETPDEIGTASVLLDTVPELYLNSFCFGYKANSLEVLSPYFSRYLFRNELFRNEIVKLAQGSTRYNMSKVQLMKLVIQLPCIAEQTKIANFLSAIDEKITHCTTQIEKTEQWKKGLLQKMFC